MIKALECPFCKEEITDFCKNHNDILVGLLYKNDGTLKYLGFTTFKGNIEYHISLSYEEKDCWIIFHEGHIRKIIKFNFLPDINPDNVKQWLERLLNMKAFL
jgi:hypothetical protein